jgi:hypothetical protein
MAQCPPDPCPLPQVPQIAARVLPLVPVRHKWLANADVSLRLVQATRQSGEYSMSQRDIGVGTMNWFGPSKDVV